MMLKGKVAVVTGAGRGIGREIAMLMARHGAQVVVNDYGGSAAGTGTESAPADEVVSEISKNGGKAVANYDSVASMAGGQAIVKKAVDTFGRVDVIVNNAGILRDRMIFNMTEEEWDAVINTHLKGTFAVTRAAAPLMREQKWGRIINMTSTSGLIGNVGQANYAAAKLGIFGLTKATALDMGRYNVTANCISPFATSSASSAVRFLNVAAATALAREVSVLKNPVPSPRALSTSRPDSSTTVTVIGALSARAFACAAFTAVSASSSVMSTIVALLTD